MNILDITYAQDAYFDAEANDRNPGISIRVDTGRQGFDEILIQIRDCYLDDNDDLIQRPECVWIWRPGQTLVWKTVTSEEEAACLIQRVLEHRL